jgi:phosphonate transport system ATP-binding protein
MNGIAGEVLPTARAAPSRVQNAGAARLHVHGLGKTYGSHVAIEDVSFDVNAGEFLAILGPSGAGKTTLFRCVAGLTSPDAGSIRLGDFDVTRFRGRERRRIAVVFQQFNLVNRLTALQNVLAGRLGYVPAWRGWLRRFERADRLLALECLDRVGLVNKARQRADTLSGGEQQRVAIARALAQQPDVILAMSRWRASTRASAPASWSFSAASVIATASRWCAACIRCISHRRTPTASSA